MPLAPICLFTYNRLNETKATVEALQKNHLAPESQLFIFSDGWKREEDKDNILAVRNYLSTVKGFAGVRVIPSEKNNGLAQSIIDGVTTILSQYDRVIVLEDDLITTSNFLDFMNQALDYYEDSPKIQSISGFSLKIKSKPQDRDVFLHRRTHSWGWATWTNRWEKKIFDKERIQQDIDNNPTLLADFKEACGEDIDGMLLDSLSGRHDSWYVRWCLDHFKKGRSAVYPVYSKVSNIGFSEEGTHCKTINVFETEIDTSFSRKFTFTTDGNTPQISREFSNYFTKSYKLMFRLKMIGSSSGRKELIKEIKSKLFDK